MNNAYEVLEERISEWGISNEEIIAVYIVGSRAREDKPFDEFSDLDVVVFSTNPDYYLQNDQWLLNICKVWTSFMFRTAKGDPEKLVLFDQGAEVDFLFRHTSDLDHIIKNGRIPEGFQRGVRMLFDKMGNGNQIIPQTTTIPGTPPISEGAYLQVVNMYCFASLYVAKQILRNDLWVAKQRDTDCKQLLLQMIEWHAKAVHGSEYDTWHAGKFINEWADQDVVADLKKSFGEYDPNHSWEALIVSLELFKRLSSEVAAKYKYAHPNELFSHIQAWLGGQYDKHR
ncbi:aminoglycoside 6-adenylyltransferase [Paenibacillus sp. FSL M7-0802]|uniref:aminoglycoside 6-adenylyltransferase n=1 Tax=Paenibacillus TaxID=44249 RepID=UPI00222309D1|nr:aminoglycoside 6-adenylyltransferase [Paenibacillus polymyxa]